MTAAKQKVKVRRPHSPEHSRKAYRADGQLCFKRFADDEPRDIEVLELAARLGLVATPVVFGWRIQHKDGFGRTWKYERNLGAVRGMRRMESLLLELNRLAAVLDQHGLSTKAEAAT